MKNIVELVASHGNFRTLVALVRASGLAQTLEGAGPFTLFAPTDPAFAKLPTDTVDTLLRDRAELTRVLQYHVLGEVALSEEFLTNGTTSRETAAGATVEVHVRATGVFVNRARVLARDIPASNGVVHVIDTVLLPRREAAA